MSKPRWRHGLSIPPDNPGYIAATFGQVPERLKGSTSLAVGEAINAHADACGAWREIYGRHGRLMAREDMLPAARLSASASLNTTRAQAARERVARALAENADLGIAARKRLAAATAAPASPGQAAIDAEVRAWLRGLPSNERLAALQAARDDGDATILRAVSSAPAPLSGLAGEVHDNYRQTYAELVAPEEAATVAAHSEAVELLRKASEELDWHVGQLGFDQVLASEAEPDKAPTHPDFPQSYITDFPQESAA